MTSMAANPLMDHHNEMQCAHQLFKLGARVQVVQSVTRLSRSRLLKLYTEINGKSPPKGLLPSSEAWYCQHEGNIHASLFWNFFVGLRNFAPELAEGELISKAYGCYLREISLHCEEASEMKTGEPVFSITRAWMLSRLMRIGELDVTNCNTCGGSFVYAPLHTPELKHTFQCTLCRPPSHVR